MKLQDIKDFIIYEVGAELGLSDSNIYLGAIDKNQNCIGIFNMEGADPLHLALGGYQSTSYSFESVRIMIHWGQNYTECENLAKRLYQILFKTMGSEDRIKISPVIFYVRLLDSSPISLGRDANNINEMVIRLKVYYYIK